MMINVALFPVSISTGNKPYSPYLYPRGTRNQIAHVVLFLGYGAHETKIKMKATRRGPLH